jgi:hypothetical protein
MDCPWPSWPEHDPATNGGSREHTVDQPDAGASTGTDASAYLARRRLRTGAAGWVLLAGLGVSYVISGTAPAGTSAWPKAVSAAC